MIKILLLFCCVTSAFAQEDFLFKYQWNLYANGQQLQRDLNDLHVEKVIASGKTNWGYKWWMSEGIKQVKKEVIVAVLDSGVDFKHPDLKDAVLTTGRNFAADKEDFDDDVYDQAGHGTHVAGIIAAKKDNVGVTGLGNFIKILPIKIFHKNEKKYTKKPLSKRIAQGIRYAVEQKADVINLSLGWPKVMHTKNLQQAIDEALAAGVTIVAAAGNSSNVSQIYPCALDEIICVGSVDPEDKISGFSNYGQNIDVFAPGEMILSTYPLDKAPLKFSVQGYEILSGTSQAAPLISGMMAILKSVFPNEEAQALKMRLLLSSQKSDEGLFGVPNIKRAITESHLGLYPRVKKTTQVILDEQSSFTLNIPFVGVKEKSAIYIESKKIKLEKKNFTLMPFASEIILEGTVLEGINEDQITIKVGQQSFKLFLEFLHKSEPFMQTQKVKSKKPWALLVKSNVKLISRLQIVSSLEFKTPQSLFSFYDEKSHQLILFKELDNEIQQFTTISLGESCRLLRFYHVDINKDQEADYLLESYCESEKDKYLTYRFFDASFKQKTKELKYYPEVALINFKNLTIHESEGQVSMTFAAVGKVPRLSKNPDPWADEDLEQKERLYQLKEKNGEFKTFLLDDYRFKEQENLKKYRITQAILGKKIKLLLITGHDWEPTLYEYVFNEKGEVEQKHQVGLGGFIAQGKFVSLSSEAFAVENFYTPFEVGIEIFNSKDNRTLQNFKMESDLRNPILNRVAYLHHQNSWGVLMRSYRYLHYFNMNQGKTQETKLPYQRLDFIGMDDLKEKTIFVEGNKEGDISGTLIVDGTQISLERVKIIDFLSDGKINSKNYHISSSCASMGLTQSNLIKMNFLCIDHGKVVFKGLSIHPD